ncbi:alpha/beta fold hydrolase [Sphingomonas mucosissima]|nr:alpha/beta hydrolase [Sphingomonas mucosissima]
MIDPNHHSVDAGGIRLHVVEQGSGPAVVFCHGFPTTWASWRRTMQATADAGFHAIAFDMRGYGDSDAPSDANLYTPFHTVGDVIAVLDHFQVGSAILVGHDFGANVAWNAAMMRADRIAAVFGVSVPFLQPGGPSFLDQLRAAGADGFYMFDQMTTEADAKWADAAHSIPASLYWLSGEAPKDARWDPFDPARHMLRPAPGAPTTIDPAYVDEMVEAFGRTGFHAPLNYYRAIDTFFAVANRAFAGCVIKQPSFFLTGEADGLNAVRNPTEASLRQTLPGLRGFLAMKGVGHWPQLEAPNAFNAALLRFLRSQV